MRGRRIDMDTWKKSFWKIPLFCVIASNVDFYISIKMLMWAVVRLPDGTITIDNTKSLIVYSVIFVATLLVGWFVLFRKMTRKEIFYSASTFAIYGIMILFVQWAFNMTTGPAAVWIMRMWRPFEMFTFIPQLLMIFPINPWISAFLQIPAVYLFVLFGRRRNPNFQ